MRSGIFVLLLVLAASVYPQNAGSRGGAGGGVTPYNGPNILGRSGSDAGMRGTEAVDFHAQVTVSGTYDSNILGYSVDSAGGFEQGSSVGGNVSVGASGRKNWRRTFLGLDYSGDYSHYSRQTFFNGSTHQLNLAGGIEFGPKVQIISQVAAGTTNRFLGGQGPFQTSEFEFVLPPIDELFDSRSYFLGNSTGAIYSFSRRSSLRVSGNFFTVRRRARGLVDLQSYGASADYVRRLSRRTSAGFSYIYSHFDFSKVFGESNIHTVGGHISRQFRRDWVIKGSLTGSKQSTVGVRSVALDPVIAALLGRTSGTEVFESNNLLYGYDASLSRRIRRSNAAVSARRGIVPGNGFFLTSINQSAIASFSHSIGRDLHVGGNFGYTKLISLGFASGALSGWVGGASLTRKLNESFGLNSTYSWRTFDLQQTNFGRNGYRVTLGITYFVDKGPAALF